MSEATTAGTLVGKASRTIGIDVPVDQAWEAIRDVYSVHERLVPGMVIATAREGDIRIVTFANGAVASERILDIDDAERRIVYGVIGNGLTFHEATMQVLPDGPGSRLTWSAKFLPREVGGHLEQVMTQGIALMKQTIERAAASV